ncbi:hypothetical protein [Clostridium luticellarii]|jgi:hypothetical protein|uniref:Uncharacterized protein n=1 Tax=Clostridium luticellarii TaxID=1691940 RepID=A0A2T0BRU1_9CLOT|nr:hypothetical protein [Clostridium luticellarii]MCI1943701.1 hypothetical protein [Clostridium luticellarii]MCI1966962.1 hypothetical protein [Clostridium luticellarii]MCI1994329.1 hypothetical protein [Clostridium luticellarii]MCI2038718.1 hypothetical protein [Clostridium luticellarii]PRR86593.1 hypothetical protein CLLU_03940 [Clostridium luticellarii]
MSFKEKIAQYYTKSYLKKYGDRLTQVQGTVISVKIKRKTILWIFNKLSVTLLVRPERSRNIVRCSYSKKRWFKKPDFIPISQGNLLLIQGLKSKSGKEHKEYVELINVRNMTTKKDLIPIEGKMPKVQRKVQRFK